MDQFEAARLKHLKRLERMERSSANQEGAQVIAIEAPEVPKEKPEVKNEDAVIDITVTLPKGTFSYRFVKKWVMRETNPSKLTESEFRNRLQEALRPLLGVVNDVNRGDH